jgi:predicted RNA-binding Zn ribbon-like protein
MWLSMNTNSPLRHPHGHDHAVDLDDTLDFLNTLEFDDGLPVERLPDLPAAVEWFVGRGVCHTDARQIAGDSTALDRTRRVRAALREVADAVVEERAPAQDALDTVNTAIRARSATELVAAPDGVGVGHRHIGDPLDDALARIVEPLVNELAGGRPERVRICANDSCRWVFYDASRAGRRRWCDMASCGNRAKAARHRARKRAGEAASDGPEEAAATSDAAGTSRPEPTSAGRPG